MRRLFLQARPRRRALVPPVPGARRLFSQRALVAMILPAVLTLCLAGCVAKRTAPVPEAAPPQPAPASGVPGDKAASAPMAAPTADLENVSEKARESYLQGYALLVKNDWSGALASFSTAFAEAPNLAGAFEGAGLAALELGRIGEAAGYFEKAAFLLPDAWPPHAYLAGIYRSQGRQELFAEECFAVISLAKGEQDKAAATIMQARDKARTAAFGAAPSAGNALRVEVSELTQAETPAPATAPAFAQAPRTPATIPGPGETRSGVMPLDESPDGAPPSSRADRTTREEEERLATARALMVEAETRSRAETKPQAEAKSQPEAKAEAEAKAQAEAKAKTEAETIARMQAEARNKAREEARAKEEARAVAEAKAKAATQPKPKVATQPKAKPEAKTAAKSKANAFVILESSWDSEGKADARAAELRGRGIAARTNAVAMNGRSAFYRVLIGGYASLDAAREAADSLAAKNGLTGLLPIRP